MITHYHCTYNHKELVLQKTVLFKKIFPVILTCATIFFASAFALKSTDFRQNHTNRKLIVTMNPVYSDGDPVPATAYVVPFAQNRNYVYDTTKPRVAIISPKKLKLISQPHKIQQVATNQPTSIIPHYVPVQKIFYKRYVETVNSYLKKQDTSSSQPTIAFQGKIPQNSSGFKQLRPVQKVPVLAYKKSYTIPIYKEYVSIQR